MKSLFKGSSSRSVWFTFLLLFVSVIVPILTMTWLIGRASENERLALEQALTNIREREGEIIRDRLLAVSNDFLVRLVESNASEVSQEVYPGVLVPTSLSGVEYRRMPQNEDARAYLSELRFLAESMGPEAVLNEIRRFLGAASNKIMLLEDGSSLNPYILLLGIEYGYAAKLETQDLVSNLITLFETNRNLPAFQRRFILSRMLELEIDSEQVQRLVKLDQIRYEWRTHGAISVSESDHFNLSGNFVYISTGTDGTLWVSRRGDFKAFLCDNLWNNVEFGVESVELMDVSDRGLFNSEYENVYDLDWPLNAFRLKVLHSRVEGIEAGVDRKILTYLGIGGVTVLISIVLVLASMGIVRRQIALAQLKNDLVATVSHELKTPISSIRILVETLLNDSQPSDEKIREYLDLINRENQRLGLLVHKFLAFSKMEKNENYFEFHTLNPRDIVKESVQTFRERFSNTSYDLVLNCQQDYEYDVVGDIDALVSALGNLLENAYKYGGRKKRIELKCSQENECTMFEVLDNGKGISKKDRRKIFEQFYQPDRRSNKQQGGVGLGLSIVSLIIRKHRGKVEIDSELGKGSCFRIILPNA